MWGCAVFWGQDSPFFPSDFQWDPKKDEEPDRSLACLWASYSHGGQVPTWYLGSGHHRRRGRHVQASLPKVHEGIITSVFCLDQAIIDFLSKENRGTLSWKAQVNLCSFSLLLSAELGGLCPTTHSLWHCH